MRAVASAHTTYSPDIVAPNGVAFRDTWRVWPSAVNSTDRWLSSIAKTGPPYVAVERIAPWSWPTWRTSPLPGFQTKTRPWSVPNATVPPPAAIEVMVSPCSPVSSVWNIAPAASTYLRLPRLSQAAPASEPEKPAARVTSGWTVSITALSEPTVRVTRPRRSSDMIASPAKATSSTSGLDDSDGPLEPPSEVAAAYPAKSEVELRSSQSTRSPEIDGCNWVCDEVVTASPASSLAVGHPVQILLASKTSRAMRSTTGPSWESMITCSIAARASTKLLVGVSRVASAP